MSFMWPFISYSCALVIKCVIEGIFNKVGWDVKKCFQGLRRTALLSAEGKKVEQFMLPLTRQALGAATRVRLYVQIAVRFRARFAYKGFRQGV
jgi:hypothetical protein